MPRRGNVPKREILPDPIYGSILVTKLVNSIMLDGKKGVAQKVVYGAFQIVEEKTGKSGLEAFQQAMENIMPAVEVKTRRVGGANYQVPIEVRPERRQTLGLRWLTNYSRARSEKTMRERLAGEIMDACNNTGAAVKKREDTHKMAESNKAFSHLRIREILASWLTSMRARRRQPSVSCSTPVSITDSARPTTVRPPWTGWSRSRSAVLPSPPLLPPATGRAFGSILLILRVTWTLRSRSSARFVCSTAP